jgi:hypothetical protein
MQEAVENKPEMNLKFTSSNFVIKRKGLSTDKFRICSPGGELLLYVEEKIKWSPPYTTTIRFFDDEKKTQELLHAQDGKHKEYSNFLDVTDPATGQKIGGVGGDWTNFFEDAWGIVDAEDRLICNLREVSTKRAILHELMDGLIPQKFNFLIGQESVAELRQKPVLIGAQLLVDFSRDTANWLDHRLGLAAAIVVAAHQAQTDAD